MKAADRRKAIVNLLLTTTEAISGSKLSEEYVMLQKHLCGFFGSKVQLSCTAKGKGKISIPFNNEEDLERIMEILDSLKKEN